MPSNLFASILNFIGKVLPFLFAYKAGSDSAKAKQTKETLDVVQRTNQSKRDTANMPDDRRDKWL